MHMAVEHDLLKAELKTLAEAEGARPVFRCGMYEIIRSLVSALEKLQHKMALGDDLLKAGRRNGWLAYQAVHEGKRFVRVDQQPWCKVQAFYEGNHRMQPSWLENRYNWLDENGMPLGIPEEHSTAS